ncbi:LOW QUALITY PROTEIN: uncharacterized protein V5649_002303 [Rhynchonycteris naso]
MQRTISPVREESTRRWGESKSGRNRHSVADPKPSHRLSFIDQKGNIQTFQEDPPSKVQYPQGVRVPRKTSVYPKDEAVQTEPVRRSVTAAEIRSPRKPSSPEHGSSRICVDSRTAQRRLPGQESEIGRQSSVSAEPKTLHRNKDVESDLMLSVLKDWDSRYQVSMHTEPESSLRYSVHTETKPSAKVLMSSEVDSNVKSSVRRNGEVRRRVTISEEHPAPLAHRATSRALPVTSPEPVYKQSTQRPSENVYTSPGPILKYPESSQGPPVHAKVELTPRPLPPRSLPRYGPESSWWALLNTEVEMPQSRPTTPDFEPPSPSPVDYSMPFFEMDSNPFCEDLIFQREKTHPSPPPPPASPLPPQLPEEPPSRAPLREVPQAPKCTSKPPIQRFSAFFLDVSEEMCNRVIWWLKGLCSPLWAHCGGLGGRRTGGRAASMEGKDQPLDLNVSNKEFLLQACEHEEGQGFG